MIKHVLHVKMESSTEPLADESFFVGYSLNSKAFRVFNSRTRIVEENLHIRFSESTPNVLGSGPDWLFDIDALTRTMNYEPIIAGTQSNGFAGTKASDNAGQARKKTESVKDYILLLLWTVDPPFSQDSKISQDDGFKPSCDNGKKVNEDLRKENECNDQEKEDNVNSTNNVNTISSTVNAAGTNEDNELPFDLNMPALEDVATFKLSSNDEDDGVMANIIQVSPTSTTRIHKDHPLNQMNVKSVFLYGKIKKEVYVCQPLGFEDPDFSDRVYKIEKALDGLHQTPRAWYETLSIYMLDNGFQRGKIDKTLFIKRHKDKFYGRTYIFLGITSEGQKKNGIFISQDKYVAEILKKFRFTKVKTASTPMETQKPLLKDEDGKEVDVHMYRLMIGSLMYLTSLRHDIMFAVCACAKYQVNPKLWSTTKAKTINMGAQIHAKVDGKKIIVTESSVRRDLPLAYEKGSAMPTDSHHKPTILQPSSSQPQKTQKPRKPKRKNTKVPQPSGSTKNVAEEAIHKKLGDRLVRAVTTASSLEAEQDSGGYLRWQEAIGDTTAQTRFESVSKHSNDLLLTRGNTLQSDEDRLKLNELMKLCTNLQIRVLDLEKIKTTQSNEIASLKRRVKKLERRNRTRTHKLERLYKVGLTARVESSYEESSDEDASKQERRIDVMGGEDVFVTEQEVVSTAAITVTIKELTLAQALEALKTSKPKVKGIVIQEQEEPVKLEVAIDAISLAVKSSEIVNWKIYKEEKKTYYQIMRADGKSQMYMERIVGIKSFLNAVGITAAHVCVNAAQLELVLLVNFNEKYTKCLLLPVKVKTIGIKVNAARESYYY
nr:hypothetical protein [Tanacetum cinerariifolium]